MTMIFILGIIVMMFVGLSQYLSSRNAELVRGQQGSGPNGSHTKIGIGSNSICCYGNITASSPVWVQPGRHDGAGECGNLPVKRYNNSNNEYITCAGTTATGVPQNGDVFCGDAGCITTDVLRRYVTHELEVFNDDTEVIITTCGYNGENYCPGSDGQCYTSPGSQVDLFLYNTELICEMPCQNLRAYDRVGTGGSSPWGFCRSISVVLEQGTWILVVSQAYNSSDNISLGASNGTLPYSINVITPNNNDVYFDCQSNDMCVNATTTVCTNSISDTDEATTGGIYGISAACEMNQSGAMISFDSLLVTVIYDGYVEFSLCHGNPRPAENKYFSMELYPSDWNPEKINNCNALAWTAWDSNSNCRNEYQHRSGKIRKYLSPGSYWLVVKYSEPLGSFQSKPYTLWFTSEQNAAYMSCIPYDWPEVESSPVSRTLSYSNVDWGIGTFCLDVSVADLILSISGNVPGAARLAAKLGVTIEDLGSALFSIDAIGDATNMLMCLPDVNRIQSNYEIRYTKKEDGSVIIKGIDLSGEVGTDNGLNFLRSNTIKWRPGNFLQAPVAVRLPDGTPLDLVFKRSSRQKVYGPPVVYSYCSRLLVQQQSDPDCSAPVWGLHPKKLHDYRSAQTFGAQPDFIESEKDKWRLASPYRAAAALEYSHFITLFGTYEQTRDDHKVRFYNANVGVDSSVIDELFNESWPTHWFSYSTEIHNLTLDEGFGQ